MVQLTTHSPVVERWGVFEAAFPGPATGNPFIDVSFGAQFIFHNPSVDVDGFYDGDGVYRLRFMPDQPGEWTFRTRSNTPALDSLTGRFDCVLPAPGNHGPVRVINRFHFAYEDGAPYTPVGATCYVWNHQGDALETQTLDTLKQAPSGCDRSTHPQRFQEDASR